jgi:hypothetical protein
MSHSESAIAGFYDHEQDPKRGTGERSAPDWGGDDLFTGTPSRRRFERPARGEQLADRRRETMEHHVPVRRAATHASSSRDVTPARAEARDVARHLDLGTIDDVMAPIGELAPAVPADEPKLADATTPAALLALDFPTPDLDAPVERDPYAEEPPAGRRTVTVTGHPDSRAMRHRPAPTVDQRLIGSRPDRIAAYAVGMGFLLILIAFLTANA